MRPVYFLIKPGASPVATSHQQVSSSGSLHWIDQQEWRLIMVEGLIPQNPLPFFKIKKVYLGNKMPQKERIKIINYCRKHSIEYIGLIRDKNSFNLIECSDDCYMCSKGNNAKSK